MRSRITALVLLTTILASQSSAHYLWVTVALKEGKHGTAKIYFEGGPSAGDGRYLKHFEKTKKTWFRTVEKIKPKILKTKIAKNKKGNRQWLQTSLPTAGPHSVDTYAKFGVYNYGKTRVLLHYYGRNIKVKSHEEMHELAEAKHMTLDIVPHATPKKTELTVLWKSKPAAKRLVYISGPKGFRKNVTTNTKGEVEFPTKAKGRYIIRTSYEIKKPGKDDDGKAYDLQRHHATLIVNLPLQD